LWLLWTGAYHGGLDARGRREPFVSCLVAALQTAGVLSLWLLWTGAYHSGLDARVGVSR
jgi:hypothetical protein